VSGTGPALLAAAAGVGFGHAVLPDHWVPLAVVGRTRRYPLSRVTRLSGAAGVAHVLVSFVLGAIVVIVGLQFRSTIESAQAAIVGGILIVTGLGFAVLELTGHGHHHDHEDGHGHGHGRAHDHDDGPGHDHGHAHAPAAAKRSSGLAAVMIPFGAAASPDLTILPVFLAATTAGIGIAIGSLLIFAAVTIGTIVGLTVAATRGGYQLRGDWLERWGNAFTALMLVIIGALVLTGVI
jgi:nickel/cobalt exporter